MLHVLCGVISGEDVKKIANLARIKISAEEEGKLQKDLSSILGYVDTLNEVDTSNVRPTAHAVDIFNVVREDGERISDEETSANIVKSAPLYEDGFIKVKAVF